MSLLLSLFLSGVKDRNRYMHKLYSSLFAYKLVFLGKEIFMKHVEKK